LENVYEIASVDGVDCLWVGHFDLTNFLGVPGDFNSNIYKDAIKRIVSAAKSFNKSLGIMVNSKEELSTYKQLGFNMIAVGTEMNILKQGVSNILKP
jgi:2-dehydro-3-deoxyglucarate aldolase/4-hydroxy-2-oxoheptanedioate aldolase